MKSLRKIVIALHTMNDTTSEVKTSAVEMDTGWKRNRSVQGINLQ